MCGFDGPIYMTHPTKAICPILLEDFRKIAVERKGETNFFTSQMTKSCMKKVVAVNLHQTVKVDDELEIKCYYAGHVLGAAMFSVKVGDNCVVYTGDYNMTPDRHLGSAYIDKIRPDLLITETTYATTIRDSKRLRERDFLKKVHSTVEQGGKVLIPVFALGRAQELCILIETYWERMNLDVPVYFSAGLTEKANQYYKLFINWTNEKIKETFVQRNMFDFKHIRPFDRSYATLPGPMVLFATPGMLHAGTSLEVFKKWAGEEKNTVIIPGYCAVGTVGNRLLAGKDKQQKVEIDRNTTIEVKCRVEYLSFSAHADAKGIMTLIQMCEPKNVMLVHGERGKMKFFKQKVEQEFHIPCFDPANGVCLTLPVKDTLPIQLSSTFVKRQLLQKSESDHSHNKKHCARPLFQSNVSGVLVMRDDKPITAFDFSEAEEQIGLEQHKIKLIERKDVSQFLSLKYSNHTSSFLDSLQAFFSKWLQKMEIFRSEDKICVRTISVYFDDDKMLVFEWMEEDEQLATRMQSLSSLMIEMEN